MIYQSFLKFLSRQKYVLICECIFFLILDYTLKGNYNLVFITFMGSISAQFVGFYNEPAPIAPTMVEVSLKKEKNETDLEMLGKFYIAMSAINGLPIRKFILDNCYEFSKVLGIPQTEVKQLYARAHTLVAELQEAHFKTDHSKAGFKKH